MTNQRNKIELDEGEQHDLLATARTLQVASLNPTGWPHLVPMWFCVDDDGLISFTTYGTSQKVRNLERDPRITVLVETGEAYNELRGISVDGEAEIVRDPAVTFHTRALISASRSATAITRSRWPAAPCHQVSRGQAETHRPRCSRAACGFAGHRVNDRGAIGQAPPARDARPPCSAAG